MGEMVIASVGGCASVMLVYDDITMRISGLSVENKCGHSIKLWVYDHEDNILIEETFADSQQKRTRNFAILPLRFVEPALIRVGDFDYHPKGIRFKLMSPAPPSR